MRGVGKLVTPEPVEPTPVEKLLDILTEVSAEARKDPEPGAECLPRYWQGKKDGIRIAMIVLGAREDKDIQNVINWQATSRRSRYTPGEEKEVFLGENDDTTKR
jgi:predicted CopG family antitoxin